MADGSISAQISPTPAGQRYFGPELIDEICFIKSQ